MSTLASKIAGSFRGSHDPLRDLQNRLAVLSASAATNNPGLGKSVIATESFDEAQLATLTGALTNTEAQIRDIVGSADLGMTFKPFSLEAATIGAMMATAPREAITAKPRAIPAGAMVMHVSAPDARPDRGFALEAYDDRENRNMQAHTTMYNLLATKQDEFAEGFYPTILTSPNEAGLVISTRLFFLFNDFKRSVTGSLANYGRKNLVRAYTDTTMLRNELTRCVPVLRDGGGADDNAAIFVDTAKAPSWTMDLGGVTVETGYLKVDNKIDKIGTSQTDQLLASGVMGPTDSLDSFIKLERLAVEFTDGTDSDVISLNVYDLPGSAYTYSVQGNTQRMQLVLDTNSLVLDSTTTKIDGAPLDYLTELATHSARVSLTITGSVTMDTGAGVVQRGQLSLDSLRNASGQLVTGAVFNALAAKLAAGTILGYTDECYRSNSNLRQRGRLLDTQTKLAVIPVPYRAPFSVLAPVTGDSSEDTSRIETLISTVNVAINGDAVNELLKDVERGRAYRAVADATGAFPESTAIGSNHVIPYFNEDAMDMALIVDSKSSADRFNDIRAAMVERLRFLAVEMIEKSEYLAVGRVMTGNPDFKPRVIIGCDLKTATYLQKAGEVSLFGDRMDTTVVVTLAEAFKGKIVMSLIIEDGKRNSEVNPLNYGNFLVTPEIVLNMPLSVDGQTSRTLTVVPRFVRFQNLPVMTYVEVSNLPAVTKKVAQNFHSV
ncbi:MAG: hypothetical protein PHN51_11655 [Candidatus Nanopelagicales bacterium]|nr:hypothetical protein [Candidatus Nanopelagicales bacterium]